MNSEGEPISLYNESSTSHSSSFPQPKNPFGNGLLRSPDYYLKPNEESDFYTLAKKGEVTLLLISYRSLADRMWLGADVLYYCSRLITENRNDILILSCHDSTLFFSGNTRLLQHLFEVDVKTKRYWVFNYLDQQHFVAVILHIQELVDSMLSLNILPKKEIETRVRNFFRQYNFVNKTNINNGLWNSAKRGYPNLQQNDSDRCGIFVLLNIDSFFNDKILNFYPEEYRQKIRL